MVSGPHAGKSLGEAAAKITAWAETPLGFVGWFLLSFYLGAALGSASWHPLIEAAVGAALAGLSVHLRTPPRWIEELGLTLGFWTAVLFGAAAIVVWLFSPDVAASAASVGSFSYTAAMGVLLWCFSSMRHPDQLDSAWKDFKSRLSGGSHPANRSVVSCALEPFAWILLLLLAFPSAVLPVRMTGLVWPLAVRAFEFVGLGAVPMPVVLATRPFWIVATFIAGLMFYIALRRVGGGDTRLGFVRWRLALGEVGGMTIFITSAILEFLSRVAGMRLVLGIVGIACLLLAWHCHRRRGVSSDYGMNFGA